MANSQEESDPGHSDPLAAVVLFVLVTEGRDGMSLLRVAMECERDPADKGEMREIETALEVLLDDGLAQRDGEIFRPSHAAIRAYELSF